MTPHDLIKQAEDEISAIKGENVMQFRKSVESKRRVAKAASATVLHLRIEDHERAKAEEAVRTERALQSDVEFAMRKVFAVLGRTAHADFLISSAFENVKRGRVCGND